MNINLSNDQMEWVCYFIEDWLRLMGYGGEYSKLYKLVKTFKGINFDFSKYPRIYRIINSQ